MDEQNIPIDINTNKLLEWLVSRRHVNKDWQNNILRVREKINNAIQDMPAHEGIIKLLSGQHINYFHCLKITELLKETEKDTKNLFGIYGSQRMKDWKDVVSTYEKDNIYLAEAAQMLIRNVSYEIPSLKKQIVKLEQAQGESAKKIKDYNKTEALALKEFNNSCENLGIAGKNIRSELLELLNDLPIIYEETSEKIKIVQPAIELYTEFNKFLSGKSNVDMEVLSTLKYLVQNGNTTTYEYTYGEKPVKIEEQLNLIGEDEETEIKADIIDFGDITLDSNVPETPASGINSENIVSNDANQEQNIDWGSSNEGSSNEGFEVINYEDVDINLEESGIVVEHSGIEGGIAKGDYALTILDNPQTREQIINNLIELEAFLKMRLFELSSDSDLLAMSQMQDAPAVLQMQTTESITALSDCVNVALNHMTNKRIQHLHNIKHSPQYLDILTASLKQKLSIVERMRSNKAVLESKIRSLGEEARNIKPVIKLLIEKTKQLQREIEQDISKKYKGRTVNIVGGVNML